MEDFRTRDRRRFIETDNRDLMAVVRYQEERILALMIRVRDLERRLAGVILVETVRD